MAITGLNKLLDNKIVKTLFLKQFKETMKNEGIKHIFISVNEDGSFDIEPFKEKMKILTLEQYTKLIDTVKEML